MIAPARVHAAAPGFESELVAELGAEFELLGEGLYATPTETRAAWAQNTWLTPAVTEITSITDAARKLRAVQRNWSLYPNTHVRRSRLIQEKLPRLVGKTLTFPEPPPPTPIGAWTLLDANHMLLSPTTDRPFPLGQARFVEDREGPPSRAYLKLWEAFTIMGAHPQRGERCLDLGSSPGGWTWVCAQLGASVLSIDKAALAPSVQSLPNVEHRQQSAFALTPAELDTFDWVLSDVICYPARLLRLVRTLMTAGVAKRFVCTLKFQGETDHQTARAFASIEGSRLLHLSHNKHELTWLCSQG